MNDITKNKKHFTPQKRLSWKGDGSDHLKVLLLGEDTQLDSADYLLLVSDLWLLLLGFSG